MDFNYTPKVQELRARLLKFMDEHVYPNEARFYREIAENRAKGNAWVPTKLVEELKPKARAAGLWNLFLPHSPRAPEGLSNLEYAPLCEIMGPALVGFASKLAGLQAAFWMLAALMCLVPALARSATKPAKAINTEDAI